MRHKLLKIRNNADLNWTTCVTAVVDNKGQRGLNYVAQRCQTVTWEGEWQEERRVKQGRTGETAAGGSETDLISEDWIIPHLIN